MTPEFKIVATESGLVITADLPGLSSEFLKVLDIVAEEKNLCINFKRRIEIGPFTSTINVPADYDLPKARAQYLNGELRIDIPENQSV